MQTAPLLVLIDCQYEHLSKASPHYAHNGIDVVHAAHRVLAEARRHNWSIIHVQMKTEAGSFNCRSYDSSPIDALKPLRSEPVFTRSQISPFSNTNFAEFMKAQKADRVFIGGFTGSYAILSTVIGCVDHSIECCVLSDLIGACQMRRKGENDDAAWFAAIGQLSPLLRSSELVFEDRRVALQAIRRDRPLRVGGTRVLH